MTIGGDELGARQQVVAQQLYARSLALRRSMKDQAGIAENLYDLETQERREWDAAPSLERAYVIHVPSDNIEKASLIKLDIEAGYRAALLANTVKNCRKHKFIDPS